MQVITFTSFNEGAGKTFISRNLGMSLVYAKKKGTAAGYGHPQGNTEPALP